MQSELTIKVQQLKQEKGIVPGLVVILVGDNPASQVYVRNKERAALAAGFKSETVRLSESICQEELIAIIERYNEDDTIHGILVQLPLPNHINDKKIILAIDPKRCGWFSPHEYRSPLVRSSLDGSLHTSRHCGNVTRIRGGS